MTDTYALKRIVSIILLGRLGYYRWQSDAILYQYQVVDVEITRISTKYKLEGIQWELGCKLPSQGFPQAPKPDSADDA